jgi:hypothetical protein
VIVRCGHKRLERRTRGKLLTWAAFSALLARHPLPLARIHPPLHQMERSSPVRNLLALSDFATVLSSRSRLGLVQRGLSDVKGGADCGRPKVSSGPRFSGTILCRSDA